MEDNVIKTKNETIIMDGGNPLPGCPNNYEQYHKWIDKANQYKEEFCEPFWSSDCGYKTDFDGPIIHIKSRFYPPKTHYGSKWDGSLEVYLYEDVIEEKSFECPTFKQLVKEVEEYKEQWRIKLKTILKV